MKLWTAAAALFLLAASSEANAGECNRYALSVATNPIPHQYPHGLEKADALLAQRPARAETVLVGDSLVANWPQDMLVRQFSTQSVWNYAVGGSTSQNTLWQIERLTRPMPDTRRVIVLIGTNNLTHDYMPACAIAAGIRTVVEQSHMVWPNATVHVMGIPPRGIDFHFRDEARHAVNAEIRNWARGKPHVRYFEANEMTITCGRYGRPVDVADASGNMVDAGRCANYADDFGHFKRAGYEVIFSEMTKAGR